MHYVLSVTLCTSIYLILSVAAVIHYDTVVYIRVDNCHVYLQSIVEATVVMQSFRSALSGTL